MYTLYMYTKQQQPREKERDSYLGEVFLVSGCFCGMNNNIGRKIEVGWVNILRSEGVTFGETDK